MAVKHIAIIVVVLLLAGGCSDLQTRRDNAERIAQHGNLQPQVIDGGTFRLLAYSRMQEPTAPLHIYIEGDGFAWVSRSQRSVDPTPYNPLALKLAAQDDAPNVLYLARPCQYLGVADNPPCRAELWSNERFSAAVIAATDRAITQIVIPGQKIELIGYSGGAAVALLVAARRHDVISIRTVAGNLDTDAFTTLHGVSPLDGSLNPRDVAGELATIPQRHFVGGDDEVITPQIGESWLQAMGDRRCAALELVPHASHGDGWEQRWRELLHQQPGCNNE